MSRLIRLLGPPAIEHDGRPTRCPRGAKPWAVLAYVLLAERPVSRRRLVDLLFTDADDPRGALRWSLSQLRRALGGAELLAGDPIEPGLGDGDVVDVLAVTQPSDRLDPVQLGYLGGELLGNLSVNGSPAFDAWLQLERRRVRSASCALLEEETTDRLVAGRYEAAIETAMRLVELEPLDAHHHALLVRAMVGAGDVVEAQAHVARCVALYHDELGSDVPDEIGRALERDRSCDPAPTVSAPALIDAAIASVRPALAAGSRHSAAPTDRTVSTVALPGAQCEVGHPVERPAADPELLQRRMSTFSRECRTRAGTGSLLPARWSMLQLRSVSYVPIGGTLLPVAARSGVSEGCETGC